MECFLCQKHQGLVAPPPGGYIYEGDCWLVCHAPHDKGPLGTLFIESRRHFLDFAEAEDQELVDYAALLKLFYSTLKTLTGAERVYQVVFLEGIPHFHAWMVPRRKEDVGRGVSFLARDLMCTPLQAEQLAKAMREALDPSKHPHIP